MPSPSDYGLLLYFAATPLAFAFWRVLTVAIRELGKPHLKDRSRLLIAGFALTGLVLMLGTSMKITTHVLQSSPPQNFETRVPIDKTTLPHHITDSQLPAATAPNKPLNDRGQN